MRQTSLHWIYKNTKKQLWIIAFLSISTAAISACFIILAMISRHILDIATGASKAKIIPYIIAVVFIIFLQAILNIFVTYIEACAKGRLEMDMRQALFGLLLKKKWKAISAIHSGEILNRFTSDIEIVASTVISIIPYAAAMLTKLLGGFAVLIYIDAAFAALLFCAGTAMFLASRILSPIYKSIHKKYRQSDGIVRSFIQESIENIVVIKSFANDAIMGSRLKTLQTNNFKLMLKKSLFSGSINAILYIVFTFGYYGALIWGAFHIISGRITFGMLTALLQIIEQIKTPMRNVSGLLPQYYSMLASAERIIELESLETELIDEIELDSEQLYKKTKGIVIENISFGYESETVFENASAYIEKNKITAISGRSGIGKSSLIRLLLGLTSVQGGRIYFDGCNHNIGSGTRCMFAYVPQGNMILSGSIRQNIAFCNQNATDEEIFDASKVACLYDFICSLENKLDTEISERGIGLSEGQLQRLAIARAILSGAPVLLLDEATSALDSETERQLLENLRRLKNKTCIFISHKKSTIEKCDVILTISNKKILHLKKEEQPDF